MPVISTLSKSTISDLGGAGYRIQNLSGPQRRLHGRSALIPNLNLSAFRLSAGIDTIRIRCGTTLGGAWRHIRRRIVRDTEWVGVFVIGAKRQRSEGQRRLLITIQNPSARQLTELRKLHYLAGPFEVFQLDVAMDATLAHANRVRDAAKVRHEVLDTLIRHALPRGACADRHLNPRWYDPTKKLTFPLVRFVSDDQNRTSLPWTRGTTYFGHRAGDFFIRIYDKTKDRVGGSNAHVELPEAHRRVRYEVVLREPSLRHHGITTIEQLFAFDFRSLRDYFNFRLPLIRTEPAESKVRGFVRTYLSDRICGRTLRAGVYFVDGAFGRNRGTTYNGTIAYWDLNARMGRALRELSSKVHRGGGSTRRLA